MERYRICELFAELLHCSNMALLNRPTEFDRLYDTEGRLQGGLAAMEELAQVIAMGAGGGADADAMDASDDELEPAGELPVSDPSTSMGDSDEDMSDGGSSDEDVMDDIAIDEPGGIVDSGTSANEPQNAALRMPTARTPVARSPAPSPSPSPPLTRKGSAIMSPTASPVVRPRSSHSRRSLRRVRRRESLPAESVPPGERLKQKFLDANILSDMLVRTY
jgi:serine/threonine-protein phosphatase 6 regulatory subunit 3